MMFTWLYIGRFVTSRVQECKFRVQSVNVEGQLGESMGGLGEQSCDSSRVLSSQLGESEAGLGEQVLSGENPNSQG